MVARFTDYERVSGGMEEGLFFSPHHDVMYVYS